MNTTNDTTTKRNPLAEYTLAELQKGIDSNDMTWGDSSNLERSRGDRNGLPNGFEFTALCRMASIISRTYPNRPIMEQLYPNGFIVKMTTASYSTLTIVAK